MTENNAINFLLYSYFELTLDDRESKISDSAIERAYRDASGRVLSITDESGGNETYKEKAKEQLNQQIRNLSSAIDYDQWLYKTCRELNKTYKPAKDKNGAPAFHFGHAQKWVNMTMKYLYVIKTIFKTFDRDIMPWLTVDLEKQLHIPVDSYIMEAAAANETISVKREKVDFSHGLSILLPGSSKDDVPYSSAKPWSKWEESEYERFRAQLEGKILEKSPLDWEGPAWIEIARIRKEREKKT